MEAARLVSAVVVAPSLLLAGCAGPPAGDVDRAAARGARLFDPATVLQDDWRHVPINGRTDYRLVALGDRVAIRAEPRESASALVRRVSVSADSCPIFEWSWRVARMQSGADLRLKARDDVAASILLMFGDPGFVFDPTPVPTLRYVWTNERAGVGEVFGNPYVPDSVRNVVVRSGGAEGGRWVTERRHIVDDYRQAFGRPPKADVKAVALFTDNDQTGEPAESYYGSGRMVCAQE